MEDVIQEVKIPADLTGIKVLNKESYNRLRLMLLSKDVADHAIARGILNQLDVRQSIYWIWRLTKHESNLNSSSDWTITNNMVYLRTKASRKFRDECQLFEIAHMDPTDFATRLNSRGWLTSEIFMRLKSWIIAKISVINKSNFYNFSITLKKEFEGKDTDNRGLINLQEND